MCEYWLGYGVYKEDLLNILFSKNKKFLSNSETQVLNEASLRYRSTAGGSQSLATQSEPANLNEEEKLSATTSFFFVFLKKIKNRIDLI